MPALRFGAFTERHVNRALATVLDDRVTSVATIISRIDDRGTDHGTQPRRDDRAGRSPSSRARCRRTWSTSRNAPSAPASARRRSAPACSHRSAASRSSCCSCSAYYRLTGLNALDVDRAEPADPGRARRRHSRDDDAAGNRRADPHHRHGRRFERADLRAHQGGAGAGSQRAGGRHRRVRPRLDHDRRHPRHVADRRGLPLPVRHESHSGVCDHADDRPHRQRLHRGVRVEDAVRADAAAPRQPPRGR